MFHSAFKKDTEKFALGNNNNLYICVVFDLILGVEHIQ